MLACPIHAKFPVTAATISKSIRWRHSKTVAAQTMRPAPGMAMRLALGGNKSLEASAQTFFLTRNGRLPIAFRCLLHSLLSPDAYGNMWKPRVKGLGAREDLLGHPLSARRLKQKQKQVASIRLVGPMTFMDVGL